MEADGGLYAVVFRASSGIVFKPLDLMIAGYPAADGRVTVSFRERKRDFGFEHQVPVGAAVDVRGPASNIEEAIDAFAVAAAAVTPLVSFCANAAIEELELESAHEATPGLSRRTYYQRYLPERAPGRQRPGRPIDPSRRLRFYVSLAVHLGWSVSLLASGVDQGR